MGTVSSLLDRLAARRADRSPLPFDMFDVARGADEARAADKLRNIYHRGQDLAWDGRAVLASLVEKHGGIRLPEEKARPLSRIFEIILWGELAAWKISAQLADRLEPLEAKMAATSQAHDEARHFYVMYDYLAALGYRPTRIDPRSQRVLDLVLGTDDPVKKLIGMQLMIETTALTLFQMVRELRIEPVLADLMPYYEKDEARHVGLGTQFLPPLLRRLGRLDSLRTIAFQVEVVFWEIASLKRMEPDLAALGIRAVDILRLGRDKQLAAYEELWGSLGGRPKASRVIERAIRRVEREVFPEP